MPVRACLALEAACSIAMAGFLIFRQHAVLPYISASASKESSQPDPVSLSLLQWLGAYVVIVAVSMVLALPNSKAGIERRPLVATVLVLGDFAVGPVMLCQVSRSDSSGMDSAMLKTFLWHLIPGLYFGFGCF